MGESGYENMRLWMRMKEIPSRSLWDQECENEDGESDLPMELVSSMRM